MTDKEYVAYSCIHCGNAVVGMAEGSDVCPHCRESITAPKDAVRLSVRQILQITPYLNDAGKIVIPMATTETGQLGLPAADGGEDGARCALGL